MNKLNERTDEPKDGLDDWLPNEVKYSSHCQGNHHQHFTGGWRWFPTLPAGLLAWCFILSSVNGLWRWDGRKSPWNPFLSCVTYTQPQGHPASTFYLTETVKGYPFSDVNIFTGITLLP